MFRVLLVDDEPLILSGIKFMIDWEKNNCEIVGTARNGQQALAAIAQLDPDIVIADINMPVMNGIELLRQAGEEAPHVVFLMLTNLQEFALAQEALRLHAVDYIAKADLEPEALEAALANAVKEAAKRKNLARVKMVDRYINTSRSKIVKHAALQYLTQPTFSPEYATILHEEGMLNSYAVLHLRFDFSRQLQPEPNENAKQLLHWEMELIEKLAQNCFPNSILLQTEQLPNMYLIYWGNPLPATGNQLVQEFMDRLVSASQNITNLVPYVQATRVFSGSNTREECQAELHNLQQHAYLASQPFVLAGTFTLPTLKPLLVTSLTGRLKAELNSRNQAACIDLLEKAAQQVADTPHEQAQAIWLCHELYTLVLGTGGFEKNDWIATSAQRFAEIENLATRAQGFAWLQKLKAVLEQETPYFASSHDDLVEKAKQFAQNHIGEKIVLQQVADYVGMSASYFSSFFKKETGRNFIDYANQLKIDRAQELIKSGIYRMNEIGYLLGFENAYYFSKVFRRYTGVSPTEYQKSLQTP
ncbi:response regulator [Ruminococcaceae bacterium OttesenSCG-928-A16]|nr:response regulator [Ruminococcaceae bacterium OttesenSCG-928-A16]